MVRMGGIEACGENGQEHQMPGELEPLGREHRAEAFRHAQYNSTIKVPHSEPTPPMTTASKAKISWAGRAAGVGRDRMASRARASPASATAIAAAARCTFCALIPDNSAASGSEEVALIARPSFVRLNMSCNEASTATAIANVITGSFPTEMSKGNCQLAQDNEPM